MHSTGQNIKITFMRLFSAPESSDVNKDLGLKAKAKAKD